MLPFSLIKLNLRICKNGVTSDFFIPIFWIFKKKKTKVFFSEILIFINYVIKNDKEKEESNEKNATG